jgi:hypothetical protein
VSFSASDLQAKEFDDDAPLFHTYVIYTMEEGVFYVGIGDDERLRNTLTIPSRRKEPTPDCPAGMPLKFVEIERRQNVGQALIVEPVFSSPDRAEVEQCERDLIWCYGACLTNVTYNGRRNARNWLPPGMTWQKFPLRDCPQCLQLYKIKMQAEHRFDSDGSLQSRDEFFARSGEYYRHTKRHAQVLPRGTPLGVEPPPAVSFATWLTENYPHVGLD